jgi:hypothetical protein
LRIVLVGDANSAFRDPLAVTLQTLRQIQDVLSAAER